jgi:hypothetical protein
MCASKTGSKLSDVNSTASKEHKFLLFVCCADKELVATDKIRIRHIKKVTFLI